MLKRSKFKCSSAFRAPYYMKEILRTSCNQGKVVSCTNTHNCITKERANTPMPEQLFKVTQVQQHSGNS